MNEKTLAACAERLSRATDERTDARKALAAEARKVAEVLVRSADHLDAGTMYESEMRMMHDIGNAGGADLGYYEQRIRDLNAEINVLRWLDKQVQKESSNGIAPGDFVVANDGRKGRVQSVSGGNALVQWTNNAITHTFCSSLTKIEKGGA